MGGVLVFGVFQQNRDQYVGVEKIYPHRGGNFVRIFRRTKFGHRRLLFKAGDAVIGIDRNHPEAVRFFWPNLDGCQSNVGR